MKKLKNKFFAVMGALAFSCCLPSNFVSAGFGEPVEFSREMDKVRLTWENVPGAVMYQVVVLYDERDAADNIAMTRDLIFTGGVELSFEGFGEERKNFYYKICPLDFEGVPIAGFSAPKPITESAEFNTVSPLPTTEFDKMDYAPLYPVYSWIPFLDAKKYQVQVFRKREDGDQLVSNILAEDHDAYEWSGYTYPDSYYFRVRALDGEGRAMSAWSEQRPFTVTAPVTVAAFGDSITHGGGATSVPPCVTLYNWETYSKVPIKNLGLSGDTTQAMLNRFERDVMPFAPKILVIMGGVNDYRQGIPAWETIEHLSAIRDKCYRYGIVPVFVTPTPINAWLMERRKLADPPYYGWQDLHREVVAWVKQQRHHIDITAGLYDDDGDLRTEYTTDGLHPDYVVKKKIGEAVGDFLAKNFADIIGQNK